MKKSSKDKVTVIVLAIIVAILGYLCISSLDIVFSSANANPVESSLPASYGVSYDVIYVRGHNFVVFKNSSGSDIEVIQLD